MSKYFKSQQVVWGIMSVSQWVSHQPFIKRTQCLSQIQNSFSLKEACQNLFHQIPTLMKYCPMIWNHKIIYFVNFFWPLSEQTDGLGLHSLANGNISLRICIHHNHQLARYYTFIWKYFIKNLHSLKASYVTHLFGDISLYNSLYTSLIIIYLISYSLGNIS